MDRHSEGRKQREPTFAKEHENVRAEKAACINTVGHVVYVVQSHEAVHGFWAESVASDEVRAWGKPSSKRCENNYFEQWLCAIRTKQYQRAAGADVVGRFTP
eukprot:6206280-Pleurochrysis_carterae.AAC.2